MLPQGESVSFVARIWLEQSQNGGPVWRGHIRHVQTGEERHFGRLAEMCGFMERLSDTDCGALIQAVPSETGPGR